MVAEFEDRNLSDSVFWGVDIRRAAFRDVNLSGVSISHALLEGVDIDAKIDRLSLMASTSPTTLTTRPLVPAARDGARG